MTAATCKKYVPEVLAVGYASLGVCYLFNLIAGDSKFTNGLGSIPILAILVLALRFWRRDLSGIESRKQLKRRIAFVLVTGFLLGMAFVMGYQLRLLGMTSLGVKGKLWILVISGGLSLAFAPVVNLFYACLDRFEGGRWQTTCGERWIRRSFPVSFLVIYVCWIPAFLAYYPAIMSYDFHRQCIEAVRGFAFFNSYQPIAHTFLIWAALQLGNAVGSPEIGMAVLTLVQMAVLALAMAACCRLIAGLTGRKWPVVVTVFVFALLPVHAVLSLSMTKDILFTAFFTLFLCLFMERRFVRQKNAEGNAVRIVLLDVGMVLTGILCIFFRNNAVYAILVFTVFAVLWSKRQRAELLALCLLVVFAGSWLKEEIRVTMGAGEGSKVEMFSVPLMQVARAAKNHRDELTTEQWYLCDSIVPEYAWEYYYMPIADGIKNNVAVTTYDAWKNDLPQMFSDWLKLGMAFPNDYIDAFLGLTSGYWFPDDVSHAEMLGYGKDTDWGLLYTFNVSKNDWFDGVESKSFLPGVRKLYSDVVNGNTYYNWPVVSALFKPATYCWILFLTMMGLLYVRKYRKLVVCMLPFWYLMTLLLGPTALTRYAYPLYVLGPVLIAWLFAKADWNVDTDECEAKENC